MKPKGLEEAASITSQTSTPMRKQSILSSLTRGDVDAAEDIFEELGHFRGAGSSSRG